MPDFLHMFSLKSRRDRVTQRINKNPDNAKMPQYIAKKPGSHVTVDLHLDQRLKPESVKDYKKSGKPPLPFKKLANSLSSRNLTYAIGSMEAADEKIYYRHGDLGLFGAIFEAWKNHWILRTSPEDWWLPVAMKVAKSIDKAAEEEAQAARWNKGSVPKVRNMFVSHEGKENISVDLSVYTIYEADYEHLFSALRSGIKQRIKVPEYAETMQNDFSSSSPTHMIASQVNLMASMQQFFAYEMICKGCGLRGLEMEGTVEDWEMLETKFNKLKEILEPIKYDAGLYGSWPDHIVKVYKMLALTRKSPNDPEVAKWWIDILCDTIGTKYIGGGGSLPGWPVEIDAYNGWLVQFLTGDSEIFAEDLKGNGKDSKRTREALSGFNQVPMKVTLTWWNPERSDESTLVAGMVGYKVIEGDIDISRCNYSEAVPSVQPHHMWAMLLPPNSPVRRGRGYFRK